MFFMNSNERGITVYQEYSYGGKCVSEFIIQVLVFILFDKTGKLLVIFPNLIFYIFIKLKLLHNKNCETQLKCKGCG